jgi:hypothetical protein
MESGDRKKEQDRSQDRGRNRNRSRAERGDHRHPRYLESQNIQDRRYNSPGRYGWEQDRRSSSQRDPPSSKKNNER